MLLVQKLAQRGRTVVRTPPVRPVKVRPHKQRRRSGHACSIHLKRNPEPGGQGTTVKFCCASSARRSMWLYTSKAQFVTRTRQLACAAVPEIAASFALLSLRARRACSLFVVEVEPGKCACACCGAGLHDSQPVVSDLSAVCQDVPPREWGLRVLWRPPHPSRAPLRIVRLPLPGMADVVSVLEQKTRSSP